MKKIGIMHGKERSFPEAFVARINSKNVPDVLAESVRIDKAMQGLPSGPVRLPLVDATDAQKAQLRADLAAGLVSGFTA